MRAREIKVAYLSGKRLQVVMTSEQIVLCAHKLTLMPALDDEAVNDFIPFGDHIQRDGTPIWECGYLH
jgi:hypothetical protein